MKHSLVKTGDPDVFPQIQDRNGEVALSYCRNCKKGEGELEEKCNPVFTINPEVLNWLDENSDIPAGQLADKWIEYLRLKRGG